MIILQPEELAQLYYNDDLATFKARAREYFNSDEVAIELALIEWGDIQRDLEEYYSE